jgi:hypothetical protein
MKEPIIMTKPIWSLFTRYFQSPMLHLNRFQNVRSFRHRAIKPPGYPGGTRNGEWRPSGPPGLPKNTDPEAKKTLWKPPRDYAYDKVVRHCPVCHKKFHRRNMMLQHVLDNWECREKIDLETRTILHHEFTLRQFNNKKYKRW